MNQYFVSYFWKTFFRKGSGMCVINTKNGMETMEGLIEVYEHIKEENGYRECIIINFKKLGDTDAEKQTSESL